MANWELIIQDNEDGVLRSYIQSSIGEIPIYRTAKNIDSNVYETATDMFINGSLDKIYNKIVKIPFEIENGSHNPYFYSTSAGKFFESSTWNEQVEAVYNNRNEYVELDIKSVVDEYEDESFVVYGKYLLRDGSIEDAYGKITTKYYLVKSEYEDTDVYGLIKVREVQDYDGLDFVYFSGGNSNAPYLSCGFIQEVTHYRDIDKNQKRYVSQGTTSSYGVNRIGSFGSYDFPSIDSQLTDYNMSYDPSDIDIDDAPLVNKSILYKGRYENDITSVIGDGTLTTNRISFGYMLFINTGDISVRSFELEGDLIQNKVSAFVVGGSGTAIPKDEFIEIITDIGNTPFGFNYGYSTGNENYSCRISGKWILEDIMMRFQPRNNSGGLRIYSMGSLELQKFFKDIWHTTFSENVEQMFGGNNSEGLIGVKYIYDFPTNGIQYEQIKIGTTTFEAMGYIVENEYITKEMTEFQIARPTNTYLDFTDAVTVEIQIPLYGNYKMNQTLAYKPIKIKYILGVFTCSLIAEIWVDGHKYDTVQCTGAIDIPVTAKANENLLTRMATSAFKSSLSVGGAVIGGIAGGLPGAVAGGAIGGAVSNNMNQTTPTTFKTGALGDEYSTLGSMELTYTVTSPEIVNLPAFKKHIGTLKMNEVNLGGYSSGTFFQIAKLVSGDSSPHRYVNEIEDLLRMGVVV